LFVSAGQQFMPSDLEGSTTIAALPFARRSVATSGMRAGHGFAQAGLSPSRQMGLVVGSTENARVGDLALQYMLGLGNGNGQNILGNDNKLPAVYARLGVGYESLAVENPKLIYLSVSGFGQTGPSSGLAAYAPAIHASSGFDLAHMAYQPGRTMPDFCGIYIADVLSGTYAFGAIATALVQRQAEAVKLSHDNMKSRRNRLQGRA
jgi:hypothetical protein